MQEPRSTLSATLPLSECRRFDGAPEAFWERFGQALLATSGSERALFLRLEAPGDPDVDGTWKPFARCPAAETGPFPLPMKLDSESFLALAASALSEGVASASVGPRGLLALHLLAPDRARPLLAVLVSDDAEVLRGAGDRVIAAQDVPLAYENHRTAQESRESQGAVTRVLEILAAVNNAAHFTEAAMALCNETAERFDASRVSVGWSDGRYIRLKAVSGIDRFSAKMDAVGEIEACLEEAADQEVAVAYPAGPTEDVITRAHAAYAAGNRAAEGEVLLSVPFSCPAGSGALFLERESRFTEPELRSLRVLGEQCAPRLASLKAADRWLGARCAASVKSRAARLLGPEHTWAKVGALVGCATFAFLAFVPWSYRVEAEFIVRSADLQHLPAPYDGYIQSVAKRVGDEVSAGEVLLALDAGQLRLEEASALASIERYAGEAQKAESEGRLADMRVSAALRAQSEAALEMARHRLGQAQLRAPFDAVLVAGDFRDKIGAPVKTGDILLRLTRLEDLYVEMKIDERDIDELPRSAAGTLAFASQPGEKFAVAVEAVEPVAVTEADGNVFVARGDFGVDPQPWWRPGMTGVAKIEAGERTLLWIFTHRLLDFLRMKLWL